MGRLMGCPLLSDPNQPHAALLYVSIRVGGRVHGAGSARGAVRDSVELRGGRRQLGRGDHQGCRGGHREDGEGRLAARAGRGVRADLWVHQRAAGGRRARAIGPLRGEHAR
eukprot:4030872-Prymnesium_polylepis.1